jgi:hypothetical protein
MKKNSPTEVKTNTHNHNLNTNPAQPQVTKPLCERILLGMDQHAADLRLVRQLDGAGTQRPQRVYPGAAELVSRLDRFLAGNGKALAVVRVPTPEEEQRRWVMVRFQPQCQVVRSAAGRSAFAQTQTGHRGAGPSTGGGPVALADRAGHARSTGLENGLKPGPFTFTRGHDHWANND